MKEALFFWAAAEGMSLACAPIVFVVFKRLPDRGYSLSKPLGILMVSYMLWAAAVTGLVPNGRGLAFLALLTVAAIGSGILIGSRGEWWKWFQVWWPYIVLVEALLGIVYFTGVFLRSFVPEIIWGEKPFELAFLNSALRAERYPPPDPWLAGYSINYYYFGYVQAATLGQLSGLPASVSFYLMLCLVASMAAVVAFSLSYNLLRLRGWQGNWPTIGGLASAALLVMVGNLEGVFELLARHGIGSQSFYDWVGIYGLQPYPCSAQPQDCSEWYPTASWWWWKATRMGSPWDVQEFPFFSFQFGDLHPHVLALPLTLAAVGLALEFFLESREGPFLAQWLREPWRPIVASMLLGGLGFTDLWALPTFGAAVLGSLALGSWPKRRWGGVLDSAAAVPIVAFPLALLYAPFYFGVERPVSGVAVNQVWEAAARGYPPVNSAVTRPVHFLIFWLPVLWLPLWGAMLEGGAIPRSKEELLWAIGPWALPLSIWTIAVLGDSGLGGTYPAPQGLLGEAHLRWETFNWLTILMLIVFMTVSGKALARHLMKGEGTGFPLGLLVLSLLLLLGAETFFVRDPLGFRYNTVFRFWYHAWTMLAVTGGVFLPSIWTTLADRWRQLSLQFLWGSVTAALAGAALLYPLMVTWDRTDSFQRQGRGLDGLAYLARSDPYEYAAIQWLNRNVKGTPVILEAFGPDFTDFARISSRTGLPTLLGWQGHEIQWRPDSTAILGRPQEIETIYTTANVGEALNLLHKYNVRYVIVGRLEQEVYVQSAPQALRAQREQALAKFNSILEPVFRAGQVVIYRVPSPTQ